MGTVAMRIGTRLSLVLAILLSACSPEEAPAPSPIPTASSGAIPTVITTIEANRYLAARIGGDRVDVVSLVPPGVDPLLWEPDRAAISRMQSADLVLLNGAGLERFRDRISLAPSKTVVLAEAYRDEWRTFEGTVQHQHGPEGEHSHTGTDPHVWMDPILAKRHADQIAREFAARFPDHADEFRARAAEVAADLDDLDRRFAGAFGPGGSPPLVASHPAYDYPAERYGWRITNFDLGPETLPEGGLKLPGVPDGAQHILWESEPAPEVEVAVRALGFASVVISTCEHAPETGDWLATMRENAARLAALSGE